MRFTKDGRVSSSGTDRVFWLELQDRFVLSTCCAVMHMPHVTFMATLTFKDHDEEHVQITCPGTTEPTGATVPLA